MGSLSGVIVRNDELANSNLEQNVSWQPYAMAQIVSNALHLQFANTYIRVLSYVFIM